LIGEQGWLAIR